MKNQHFVEKTRDRSRAVENRDAPIRIEWVLNGSF